MSLSNISTYVSGRNVQRVIETMCILYDVDKTKSTVANIARAITENNGWDRNISDQINDINDEFIEDTVFEACMELKRRTRCELVNIMDHKRSAIFMPVSNVSIDLDWKLTVLNWAKDNFPEAFIGTRERNCTERVDTDSDVYFVCKNCKEKEFVFSSVQDFANVLGHFLEKKEISLVTRQEGSKLLKQLEREMTLHRRMLMKNDESENFK